MVALVDRADGFAGLGNGGVPEQVGGVLAVGDLGGVVVAGVIEAWGEMGREAQVV